jgi:acetate kinase
MKTAKPRILIINSGSSSIKFALFEAGDSLQRILAGQIERIGNMSAKQFNKMVNSQSGLLGVSETHSDMRDLLDSESRDVRATEAVLPGQERNRHLRGGIGRPGHTRFRRRHRRERVRNLRSKLRGLGALGIELEEKRNVANAGVISAAASRVTVHVLRTDEELMIARSVWNIVKTTLESEVPPNAGMSIEGEGATK